VRIVDQPLPTDRRAGLLEVDPHHHAEVVGQLVGEQLEAAAVLQAGLRIVDRARPDHHDQAVVLAVEDLNQGVTSLAHGDRAGLGERELLQEDRRRDQRTDAFDAKVSGLHR
jgi:hypothetical protein